MSDNRRPTYLEVGTDDNGHEVTRRIWRASSLGACDRSLVMHALEHDTRDTPAAIQRAYDAGTNAEAKLLRRADTKGWRMLDAHEMQAAWGTVDDTGQLLVEIRVGVVDGVEQVIRCHPDGIALKYKSWPLKDEDQNGTRRVVEAKFLRKGSPHTSVAKARASRFYSWQTSVEMHATGLGLLMIVGWKTDDDEVDPGPGGVDIEVFDDPMYALGKVKARVFRLAGMVRDAQENGLGGIECDWAMYPCPFYDTHDGQKVHAKKGDRAEGDGLELGDDGAKEITYLAGEVERHRLSKDASERLRKAAAEKLLIALKKYGAGPDDEGRGDTYVVGSYEIQYKITPARDAEEKVVQYKAREASETVVVKQRKKGMGE